MIFDQIHSNVDCEIVIWIQILLFNKYSVIQGHFPSCLDFKTASKVEHFIIDYRKILTVLIYHISWPVLEYGLITCGIQW